MENDRKHTGSARERTLQISVVDQFWDILNLGCERLIKWLKTTAPQLTHSNSSIEWIKTIDVVTKPEIQDFATGNSENKN